MRVHITVAIMLSLSCSVDLGSGNVHTVASGQGPAWGADSRHLIFADGGSVILLDAQTGQKTTLVSGLGKISEPTWSR